MNRDAIQLRIEILQKEQAQLKEQHEALVQEYQERTAAIQKMAQENAIRSQRIAGAITELKQLIEDKPNEEKNK